MEEGSGNGGRQERGLDFLQEGAGGKGQDPPAPKCVLLLGFRPPYYGNVTSVDFLRDFFWPAGEGEAGFRCPLSCHGGARPLIQIYIERKPHKQGFFLIAV